MVEAYPLQWPVGKPRTEYPDKSRFSTEPRRARELLLEEIERLGGSLPVISSNLPLRRDGLPKLSTPQPRDTGVAVYFLLNGQQMCFACDRWALVHDNMLAIAKTIEALRGIERWGSTEMAQAAFVGFTALPAPASCWDVLGIVPGSSPAEIDSAYRRKAKELHPDVGGDVVLMAGLNKARDEAMEWHKRQRK